MSIRTLPYIGPLVGALVCGWGCQQAVTGPVPVVSNVTSPYLVCNEQLTTPVSLRGSGFAPLPVDTALGEARLELPRVSLTLVGDLEGGAVMSDPIMIADDSTMPEQSGLRWISTEEMIFVVDEALGLGDGVHAIEVQNPSGATASSQGALVAVPRPRLEQVEPMAICLAERGQVLELSGSGFLRMSDGGVPEVALLDGSDVVATFEPTEMGGCATLPAPATDAESCTSVVIEIPVDLVEAGTYSLVLTNPPPAACMTTDEVTVEVVPPPDLTDVSPATLCTSGGTIGLLGEFFRDGATVTVDGIDADSVTIEAGGMAGTATFGRGFSAGVFDVTLTNPEGCSDTLTDAINIIDAPILFFVDPPVVYSGISTQITIYVSGATDVEEVVLVPTAGGEPIVIDHSFDLARGRILAVVPVGTAAGEYDVQATSGGCPATLPSGLTVTDELSVTVDGVDPSFGYAAEATPVAVSGGGFQATPRAYLNPATPDVTTVARALNSVAFLDDTRLTASVGAGLPSGVYDLIVVNPDGGVGLLEDAFSVTDAPPPVIDFVVPGEVANDADVTVTAAGSGFGDLTATWTCRAPDGVETTLDGTVSSSDAESAEVVIPSTGIAAGTICVLRLTNAGGSYGEYSAVSVTAPSSNLAATRLTSPMLTARTGLALVAARANRQARFLHALGGDDGAGVVHDTSESVSVDPFGRAGTWFAQPNGLPAARTDAVAVTIGRQMYLAGGFDGTSPVSSVARAEVLDPSNVATITDIAPRRAESEPGLDPGVWYYRISAVMPASHPTNPGGETLASDPLVIDLPTGLPANLVITLFWSEIEGAESYRIYRSPTPDLISGSELLLATVDGSTREFEDDGSATPAGAAPLPAGAHGTWVTMPSLTTARQGAAAVVALDPSDPSVHYIYLLGGENGAGALDSYEFLAVTVGTDGAQTVAASWVTGDETLGAARSQLAGYVADARTAPDAATGGEAFVYAVGGLSGTGMPTSRAEAAAVTAGGQLAAFAAISDLNPRSAGFAHMAGNGFLYVFGGGPSPVRASAISAEICHGTCTAPEIVNWNAQGFNIQAPRYRGAGAIESAHLFIVGGQSMTGGAALTSAETTVW